MRPGDRVVHPKLGTGILTELRLKQSLQFALVDFGYTVEYVPADSLRSVGTAVSPRPIVPSPGSQRVTSSVALKPLAAEVAEARKGIIALKLGQIMESQVGFLSVGTQVAEKQLAQALTRAAEQRPTVVMVEGAWGGGKTHLLTLLSAMARREKFVVTSVVMDGLGVTLSDPMQLMEALTSGFRFPNEQVPGGLAHHLIRALRGGRVPALRARGAHVLAEALEQIPERALDEPEALHVLEDYLGLSLASSAAATQLRWLGFPRIRLPALKARSIEDRAGRFSELLHNWAQFVAALGARGLLIIMDELDVEYASTMWNGLAALRLRERRRMFLQELGRLTRYHAPVLLAFGSAPAGPDVAAEHDAVRDVRAATGGVDFEITVPEPREDDLRVLSERVRELYSQAYPASATVLKHPQFDQALERLLRHYMQRPNPVPRQYVRMVLELLDILSSSLLTTKASAPQTA